MAERPHRSAASRFRFLTPAKKVMATRQSKDDPEANCLPTGIPRQAPHPWRIVQDPTHYYILFEGNIHSFRQIFADGKHPADQDPTWYGHSTGTWEGETLVVDTIGFNDRDSGSISAAIRIPNSSTVERATSVPQSGDLEYRDDHHRSRRLHQAVHGDVRRSAAAE